MITRSIANTVVCLSLSLNVLGQNIYPEKIEGCNTELFSLESKTPNAKKSNSSIASVIAKAIDKKVLKKTNGVLKIQVIAYEDYSSCMYSYENRTNMLDQELNMVAIKQAIDEQLIWDSVYETCSPMIELYFKKGKIRVRRMGFDGNDGLHELKDL
ncbi:MAG: hypothetical protein NWQ09_00610 [Nonlabens sp.]|nr:hypothetical protein [Nonlabens sp.]